jgi:hypothetical protein
MCKSCHPGHEKYDDKLVENTKMGILYHGWYYFAKLEGWTSEDTSKK